MLVQNQLRASANLHLFQNFSLIIYILPLYKYFKLNFKYNYILSKNGFAIFFPSFLQFYSLNICKSELKMTFSKFFLTIKSILLDTEYLIFLTIKSFHTSFYLFIYSLVGINGFFLFFQALKFTKIKQENCLNLLKKLIEYNGL